MALKENNHPKRKKSKTGRGPFQILGKAFDDCFDSLCQYLENIREPIKFNQYLKFTERYIDDKIIKECKEKRLIFIGGKCRISVPKVIDDKETPSVLCNVDLFFQDVQKQWVKSSISGETLFSKFDQKDPQTVKNLEELADGAIKENEIEPPDFK